MSYHEAKNTIKTPSKYLFQTSFKRVCRELKNLSFPIRYTCFTFDENLKKMVKTLVIDGPIGPYGYSKQLIRNELAGQFMNEDQIEKLIINLKAEKQNLNGEQDENPADNINWDLINNLPHNKMVDENF